MRSRRIKSKKRKVSKVVTASSNSLTRLSDSRCRLSRNFSRGPRQLTSTTGITREVITESEKSQLMPFSKSGASRILPESWLTPMSHTNLSQPQVRSDPSTKDS